RPTRPRLSQWASHDGGGCGSSFFRHETPGSFVHARPPGPPGRVALSIRLFQPAVASLARAAVGGGEVRPTGLRPPHPFRAKLVPRPRDVAWHDRSPTVRSLPPSGLAPNSKSRARHHPPPIWPGRVP